MGEIEAKKTDGLELKNITKRFPGVMALNNVSITLKPGEVHALVGENGAGKSTLIKIISGMLRPDEGQLSLSGEAVTLHSAQEAFDLGIGVVHQERNLIPTFTIAENICFDQVAKHAMSIVHKSKLEARAKKALKLLELDLDPSDGIDGLSSAKMQMLEIARALSADSKILLLDEPTASITVNEVKLLLDTVRSLRNQGVAILYVSHKLEEIFEIADTITILRDGCVTGEAINPKDLTRDELIERMVGRKEDKEPFPQRKLEGCPMVMEAKAISGKAHRHANSFALRKGEILGWYGLVGAGRTELARQLIGFDPIVSGELYMEGKPVQIRSTGQAFHKYGIYYISEDRKGEGLFLQHGIDANISVASLDKIMKNRRFISKKLEKEHAEKYRQQLSIKTPDVERIVSSLSGGNQQKVCIAKGLFTDPNIIIIDEPTVGIDVKTKAEIHRLIFDLAEQGKSIILISSDLTEMVRLADRILVFREGSICGEVDNSKSYSEMSSQIMDKIIADTV